LSHWETISLIAVAEWGGKKRGEKTSDGKGKRKKGSDKKGGPWSTKKVVSTHVKEGRELWAMSWGKGERGKTPLRDKLIHLGLRP